MFVVADGTADGVSTCKGAFEATAARPRFDPNHPVNHSAASGPTVIPLGARLLVAPGIGYSLKTPAVVIRPMVPSNVSRGVRQLSQPLQLGVGGDVNRHRLLGGQIFHRQRRGSCVGRENRAGNTQEAAGNNSIGGD